MTSLLNEFMRSINKKDRKALLKDSFKSLEKIPLFIVVLKKNQQLEKENAKLQKTIVSLCKKFYLGNFVDSNNSDTVEILETPEKENIVYTIDDDSELFSSPPVTIKQEKKTKTTIVVEDMPITLNGKQWSLTVEDNVTVDEEEEEVEEEEEEVEVEEEEEEEEVEVEEEEEEEEVEEVKVDEQEEEVYEIQIKGKTYYVTNEINSTIYEADADGDISIEAGVYKNGKPVFIKR